VGHEVDVVEHRQHAESFAHSPPNHPKRLDLMSNVEERRRLVQDE